MKYRHTFQVNASLSAVAEFHTHADSMAAITPPPIITQIHRAPQTLSEGDEMDFTLWLGPIPLRWLARIEDVSQTGFTDRQLAGPMGFWRHKHTFSGVSPSVTAVIDEIELELRRHPLWWPIGLGMRLGLPMLFAYRGWKTRRLLGQSPVPATKK